MIVWLGIGYAATGAVFAGLSFASAMSNPRLRKPTNAVLTAGVCVATGVVWPFCVALGVAEKLEKRRAKKATATPPEEWPSPKLDESLPELPLEELEAALPKSNVITFPARGGDA